MLLIILILYNFTSFTCACGVASGYARALLKKKKIYYFIEPEAQSEYGMHSRTILTSIDLVPTRGGVNLVKRESLSNIARLWVITSFDKLISWSVEIICISINTYFMLDLQCDGA